MRIDGISGRVRRHQIKARKITHKKIICLLRCKLLRNHIKYLLHIHCARMSNAVKRYWIRKKIVCIKLKCEALFSRRSLQSEIECGEVAGTRSETMRFDSIPNPASIKRISESGSRIVQTMCSAWESGAMATQSTQGEWVWLQSDCVIVSNTFSIWFLCVKNGISKCKAGIHIAGGDKIGAKKTRSATNIFIRCGCSIGIELFHRWNVLQAVVLRRENRPFTKCGPAEGDRTGRNLSHGNKIICIYE